MGAWGVLVLLMILIVPGLVAVAVLSAWDWRAQRRGRRRVRAAVEGATARHLHLLVPQQRTPTEGVVSVRRDGDD